MIHLPGSDGPLFPPSPRLVYPIPSILLRQQNQRRRYGVEEEAEGTEKRRVKKEESRCTSVGDQRQLLGIVPSRKHLGFNRTHQNQLLKKYASFKNLRVT